MNQMWKVEIVQPVKVIGTDGYPYDGFNVTTEDGKPVASFAFASKAVAEQAATDLLNELSVHPHVGLVVLRCRHDDHGIPCGLHRDHRVGY
jgi:hypothetical protein